MIGEAFDGASTHLFVSSLRRKSSERRRAMRRQAYGCDLEAALAVVGGKWKPIVLWRLSGGARRFGELRRLVTGISEKVLIQQLREMEADGIVARKDCQEVPPRGAYSLTPRGFSLV